MHQSEPQTTDYKMCYQVAIACGFSHKIVPTYMNIYTHMGTSDHRTMHVHYFCASAK